MLVIIDNYDSFVHNVARYFKLAGREVLVFRNDKLSVAELRQLNPAAIVISPGPGGPRDAGVSVDVIRAFTGVVPILGICLGHQCIGSVYGLTVERADTPMHGRASHIVHTGRGLFKGLPPDFEVGRYHSLIVKAREPTSSVTIDALSHEGEVMAISSEANRLYGIQFHPESILTKFGHEIITNFLRIAEH
ncbi:anthranilate synthase component II [Rhizobium leguminosarum]|uniref:anthranilate synthase component II n=1 Tax=Rhizobium leguminosarum TaxID=384 RepID=UPI00161ACFA6|nr:aminodeoxychorismate/anthranilate synthase component II [Rhizobium leguminosarum]MBB4342987.1 anthranilate synthase/aminodeoxychorismate synthase-like glutamine amidotransferase [Rhizobium leguminosarum]MBB6296065.1 anthranilate synthase/aminodeoxychorismate synthase-like glutamine amidotransferase [Rhizobium leguminosarum]